MLPPTTPSTDGRPSAVRRLARLTTRPWAAYPLTLALLALVSYADIRTGDEVVLVGFYLVPVAFLSYCRGRLAGLGASGVAAGALVLATGPTAEAAGWNAAMFFVAAAGVAWALSRLRADRTRILLLLESERRLFREDRLTGVASRAAFYERLALELERMDRHGRPMSLLFLDLDDFKRVNDERGHPAGDRALARVGRLLLSVVRKVDLCARLGGDEFAILMPETGIDDADAVARRVREAVEQEFAGESPRIGVSAGLGTFEHAPQSAEDPVGIVDRLMYEAKRGGKNRIVERTFR